MGVLEDDDFDESLLLAVDQWESEYIARSSGVANAPDASLANNSSVQGVGGSSRAAQNQSWAAPAHQSMSRPDENFLALQPHTQGLGSVSAARSCFIFAAAAPL
jgi:hypothetical protein